MGQSDEAWSEVGEQLKTLGSMFKNHYQAQEDVSVVEVVSEDEVKDALRVLGESVKAAFSTVGDAFTDPEIHTEARQTAGAFFDALGVTFSELGRDISNRDESEDPSNQPFQGENASPDAFGDEDED
jgi:hypothetical protein